MMIEISQNMNDITEVIIRTKKKMKNLIILFNHLITFLNKLNTNKTFK